MGVMTGSDGVNSVLVFFSSLAEKDENLRRMQGDLDSALAEKNRLMADLDAQRKKNNVSRRLRHLPRALPMHAS